MCRSILQLVSPGTVPTLIVTVSSTRAASPIAQHCVFCYPTLLLILSPAPVNRCWRILSSAPDPTYSFVGMSDDSWMICMRVIKQYRLFRELKQLLQSYMYDDFRMEPWPDHIYEIAGEDPGNEGQDSGRESIYGSSKVCSSPDPPESKHLFKHISPQATLKSHPYQIKQATRFSRSH